MIFSKKEQEILNLLNQEKKTYYIVGGYVRDYLLGKNPNDLDIEIYDTTIDELKKIFHKYDYEIFFSYGVFKFKNINISISLPRIDIKKDKKGYHNIRCIINPNFDINFAYLRRDITINSIYYDPYKKEYIDFVEGITDINNKIIRAISNEFINDPMRLYRIIKFINENPDFQIEKNTYNMCLKMNYLDLPLIKQNELIKIQKNLTNSKKLSYGEKQILDFF